VKLHDLRPAPGARKPKKRIGRGIGSGHGVTATKGTKGQKAREGFRMIPGFEGGQIRMIKRLPHKRGFTNNWRIAFETYNVGLLGRRFEAGATIDIDSLQRAGMRTSNLPIKILGDGNLRVALTITAHKFSKSAREKVEAAGGTVNELGVKTPHGKPHKITAKDVTITHGEQPRVRGKGRAAAAAAAAAATETEVS
jgi:large subunit ribosomal protein L15